MSEFLKKIKLIQDLSTEVVISKDEFISKLSMITEKRSTELLSDPFEALRFGSSIYKGHVGSDNFNLKRKKKLFSANLNLAVAEGVVEEKHGKLWIDAEINGFNKFFLFIVILLIIIYVFAAFIISVADENSINFLPFIFIHAIITFSILYFILRISVNKLKKSLLETFKSFENS